MQVGSAAIRHQPGGQRAELESLFISSVQLPLVNQNLQLTVSAAIKKQNKNKCIYACELKMRTEKDSKENETLYKNYISFVLLFISVSCFAFPKLNSLNTWVSEIKNRLIFLGGALGSFRRQSKRGSQGLGVCFESATVNLLESVLNKFCGVRALQRQNQPEHHCLTKANFLIMFLVVRVSHPEMMFLKWRYGVPLPCFALTLFWAFLFVFFSFAT